MVTAAEEVVLVEGLAAEAVPAVVLAAAVAPEVALVTEVAEVAVVVVVGLATVAAEAALAAGADRGAGSALEVAVFKALGTCTVYIHKRA